MGEARYYLKYICADGHPPIEWSSLRDDTLSEPCKQCGKECEPHIISLIVGGTA